LAKKKNLANKNLPKKKRKPWVPVVAAICAIALAGSSLVYLFQLTELGPGRRQAENPIDQLHDYAEYLDQEIEEEGDSPELLLNLGMVYGQLAIYKGFEEEDGEAQEEYLGKSVEVLERSANEFNLQIEEEGESPELLLNLAAVYEQLATYKGFEEGEEVQKEYSHKSVEVLEKGHELYPEDPEFPLFLYQTHLNLGEQDKAYSKAEKAETLIKEALEQEDMEDEAEYRLHWASLLKDYHHDLDAAEEQLEMVMDLEPEDSGIYNEASQMLGQIKMDEETGADLEDSLPEDEEEEDDEETDENHEDESSGNE